MNAIIISIINKLGGGGVFGFFFADVVWLFWGRWEGGEGWLCGLLCSVSAFLALHSEHHAVLQLL